MKNENSGSVSKNLEKEERNENEIRDIDLVIPSNNKGKKSPPLVYWLLAREDMRERGDFRENKGVKRVSGRIRNGIFRGVNPKRQIAGGPLFFGSEEFSNRV